MFIGQQPTLYPTDDSRIAFVCSLLTGRALEWATAIWEDDHAAFPSFASFTQNFREVFEHPAGGKEVGEQLLSLRQGGGSAADYALSFRTLAAQTGWRDAEPLKLLFRKGLNHELQSELACRDEGKTLEQFINLAIRLDNLLRSRRLPRSSFSTAAMATAPPAAEPMQIGVTHLSGEERERRVRLNLCLYCGLPGHMRASCPTRPSRNNATVSQNFSQSTFLNIPVRLRVKGTIVDTVAFIDSGAAGNFIDAEFAKTHKIPLVPCESHLAVAALDGRPLGSGRIHFTTEDLTLLTGALHTETIRLFVFQSPQTPLILGLPWLERHNPHISWSERQISRWSEYCLQNCLSRTSPEQQPEPWTTSNIPGEYHDLATAFSKTKASQLPPHRSCDCAIDLLPGSQPPKGRVFPLSQPESEAMKTYIEEELAKGFIRPSISPASAGFFFVKKKDGGLRPCIDYRGLNDISVKFRYPLPLVPASLEQLRKAKYFTKLDLRSAYNLIRIREGDEWKTAFSTTSGHYEYLVMPFGLSNSPSVFQAFINEVFRDMLNRWVVVYIDDILIYSDSYEDHVQHVRMVLQRLIANQLYAKTEKCEFHQSTVSFLGYVISSGGVAMDERKVRLTPPLTCQSHLTPPLTCQSPHASADLPESPHASADLPESPHASADLPESPHASADLPESPHASADLPESPHASADLPESPHASADLPESPHASADLPESPHASADLPESPHASADLPESPHASADLPESPHASADLPESPHASADLPESPHASADLPESPHASADLPESPHASADLPESPHASADLPESPHASADLPESPHASADLPESPHASADLPESPHVPAVSSALPWWAPVSLAPHGPGPPSPPPVPPPLHRPPGFCFV